MSFILLLDSMSFIPLLKTLPFKFFPNLTLFNKKPTIFLFSLKIITIYSLLCKLTPSHILIKGIPAKNRFIFKIIFYDLKGIEKLNLQPFVWLLSAQILPPCISINSLQSNNPNPVPFSLFVPKVE